MDGFWGYRRPDGGAGTRNYLAVISTVGCINEVTRKIAARIEGSKPILHHQGCAQLPPDLDHVSDVLINLGTNPNVAAALVVGLGCEGVEPAKVVKGIAATGRPVASICLQEIGGYSKAVAAGVTAGTELMKFVSAQQRTLCGFADLAIGIKCGASDTTQGLAANPSVGVASDHIVALGATSIFTETTEVMGAERVLAQRAATPEVGEMICRCVRDLEQGLERYGVDMRGGQPTRGNIMGGITSIEEKSLGAICKAGHAPIQYVLRYGQRPSGRGLYFMDSPGREIEALTGLAAAGSTLLVFATGLGAPQGFPIAPVVKVSGNARTCAWLSEHIDIDVSGVIDGQLALPEAGERIFAKISATASGETTKAEIIGYDETMDIYVTGPSI